MATESSVVLKTNSTTKPRSLASTLDLLFRIVGAGRHVGTCDEESNYSMQAEYVLSPARNSFVQAASNVSTQEELESMRPFLGPFVALIEQKYDQLDSELATALADDEGAECRVRSVERFFEFLTAVISIIKDYEGDTLSNIKERLVEMKLLSDQTAACKAYALTFFSIGIVTMLFSVSPKYVAGRLNLHSFARSPDMPRERSRGSSSRELNDNAINEPLDDFLYQLCPKAEGPLPHPYSENHARSSEHLASSNLNYFTLAALAGLQIVWVDSICEHLELDRKNKSLSLFRYPSLCMVLCANHRETTTFIEQLFSKVVHCPQLPNPAGDSTQISLASQFTNRSRLQSGDFFREILYSYCVIFGQQAQSRKRFMQDCKKGLATVPQEDPLLEQICRSDWETGPVYGALSHGEAKLSYSADYVKTQEPNSWRSLWHDRRDVNRFYTFWAAVIFGVAALSLGMLQVLLAIAQVVGSFLPSK